MYVCTRTCNIILLRLRVDYNGLKVKEFSAISKAMATESGMADVV